MGGPSLPPGLRFPTGGIMGTHVIIAGTYLAHTHQSFAIWSCDTSTMRWTRLETGATMAVGTWCRGTVWEDSNKFLVFGNREGNLVEDYNRRILSWDDVTVLDLETYGIYLPPYAQLDIQAQELGLAALEEELLADFEMVCDDDRRIKCNRKVLERRWQWFEKQRVNYVSAATKALDNIPKSDGDVPLPQLPSLSDSEETPPDPRLTPRSFHLAEPYAITLGFVQYLYCLSLITNVQHAPAVLSGLLLLSSTYELPHLRQLVTHAMHRVLSQQTSIGIYETATLCSVQALQIRSLRYLMVSGRLVAFFVS
jgi:leucine-zipper-like transcriptional regulator 1